MASPLFYRAHRLIANSLPVQLSHVLSHFQASEQLAITRLTAQLRFTCAVGSIRGVEAFPIFHQFIPNQVLTIKAILFCLWYLRIAKSNAALFGDSLADWVYINSRQAL